MEQLDLFGLLAEVEKNETVESRADLPDVVRITVFNPLRNIAPFWATDFTWHMAIHECKGLLEARKKIMSENPCLRYIRPVIYCDAWKTVKGEGIQHWRHIEDVGHRDIDVCPYCGADLNNGKGTIILERRFKDRPYHCVYERERPEISVAKKLWETITEQLTPDEIQEVVDGTAEIIFDTEPLCPICHEPPCFTPKEMVGGDICYHIGCKCGSFPKKNNNTYSTKEIAIEYWLDPVKRERTW